MLGHGTVSIHAENIMPVIKQWLYSDKDIFVREVVSNACDAISKHRRLVASGEAEKDENPYRIDVIVDKAAGTLTFTDNGIGMTADEVEKYIAQVAFSGASDFIQKYAKDGETEDTKIIGHFGLGFYSVFMVSKKVVIDTKSYTGAPAVRWTSEDGMSYDMEESDRTERGTSITLYISDEDADFLNVWTVRATLEKHCAFMPAPIFLSEVPEPAKDGEEAPEKKEREPAVEQAPQRVHRRGLQGVLPQGVPRLRGSSLLDSPKRRIPVQSEGYSLFSAHQERAFRQRGHGEALQQSSLRRG